MTDAEKAAQAEKIYAQLQTMLTEFRATRQVILERDRVLKELLAAIGKEQELLREILGSVTERVRRLEQFETGSRH